MDEQDATTHWLAAQFKLCPLLVWQQIYTFLTVQTANAAETVIYFFISSGHVTLTFTLAYFPLWRYSGKADARCRASAAGLVMKELQLSWKPRRRRSVVKRDQFVLLLKITWRPEAPPTFPQLPRIQPSPCSG